MGDLEYRVSFAHAKLATAEVIADSLIFINGFYDRFGAWYHNFFGMTFVGPSISAAVDLFDDDHRQVRFLIRRLNIITTSLGRFMERQDLVAVTNYCRIVMQTLRHVLDMLVELRDYERPGRYLDVAEFNDRFHDDLAELILRCGRIILENAVAIQAYVYALFDRSQQVSVGQWAPAA